MPLKDRNIFVILLGFKIYLATCLLPPWCSAWPRLFSGDLLQAFWVSRRGQRGRSRPTAAGLAGPGVTGPTASAAHSGACFAEFCCHESQFGVWSAILQLCANLANCVNTSWLRSAFPGFWNACKDTISWISISLCTVFLEVGLHMVFICINRTIRTALNSYTNCLMEKSFLPAK